MNWRIIPAIMALFILTISIREDAQARAQPGSCPQLVQSAYQNTQLVCDAIDADEACYGNFTIEAQPQTLDFDQSGDIVGVEEIDSLRLSSMNETSQEWGISVMNIQALVAGAVAPTSAELVLFGNVEIANAADENSQFAPMQAFTFVSGVNDRPCEEAPDSGIMIQTPEGAGEITLLVNEVMIDLGSTAYLQAEPGVEMEINIVEGQAQVTVDGEGIIVPAGAMASVPLDENGTASGQPQGPVPYDETMFVALPVTLLNNQIEIAPPLRPEGFVPQNVTVPTLHIVQDGETLYSIALQYGLTWDVMAAANGIINPDLVFVGQNLVIPPPDFPVPTGAFPPQPPPPVPQDEIPTGPEIVTEEPIGIVNGYNPQPGTPEDNECNLGGTMYGNCSIDELYLCGWMMARYNRNIISREQVQPQTCLPPPLPPPPPECYTAVTSVGSLTTLTTICN